MEATDGIFQGSQRCLKRNPFTGWSSAVCEMKSRLRHTLRNPAFMKLLACKV